MAQVDDDTTTSTASLDKRSSPESQARAALAISQSLIAIILPLGVPKVIRMLVIQCILILKALDSTQEAVTYAVG